MAKKSDVRGLAAMSRGMALRDSSEDIAPDLNVPVLVVEGKGDSIVPWAEAERSAAIFPNARLEAMGASGHCPMLEEPERLAELLANFTAS